MTCLNNRSEREISGCHYCHEKYLIVPQNICLTPTLRKKKQQQTTIKTKTKTKTKNNQPNKQTNIKTTFRHRGLGRVCLSDI